MTWFSMLKLVPWREVIQNAPALAQSAQKFWKRVTRETATAHPPEMHTPAQGDEGLDSLRAQLHALQVNVSHLQREISESSQLIKTLADQNEQLVKRVGVHRFTLLCLAAITLLLAVTRWL